MPDPDQNDGEPPPRLLLEVVHDGGDWSAVEPLAPVLDRLAPEFARELCLEIPSIAAVALSSDERVRALNRRYRGKDRVTNVLSFPARDGNGPEPGAAAFLGDIVLASARVLDEAHNKQIPARHHVQHLVVHGVLHLLGYDHASDAEARVMEGLEVRILARLGIPDPYAPAAVSSPALPTAPLP